MDRRQAWIEAARPRTLPAAIAPVLAGSGLAIGDRVFRWDAFVAALIGALAIQVAANFANDASDAKRGADTPDRVGPPRMVALGIITPRRMWLAVIAAVGLAAFMGVWLIAIAGWWIALIGVVSIVAMLTYVGGPIPYGYRGLGEVMVFVFFGLVATLGTRYAHDRTVDGATWIVAVIMGALAAAILVANNLRDLDTDAKVGKRTLAVMLGRARAERLYAALIFGPFLVLAAGVFTGVLPTLCAAVIAVAALGVRLWQIVRAATGPTDLVPVLGGTARLQLLVGILIAITVAI